jgi:hypothetical protein
MSEQIFTDVLLTFRWAYFKNCGSKIVYFNSPCIRSVKKKLKSPTCEKLFLNSQTPKLRFFVLCFGFNQ